MSSLSRRSLIALASAAALSACGGRREDRMTMFEDHPPLHAGETPQLRAKIDRWAREYDVPATLVHRVVQRESRYNPGARNGPYMGLMQIHPRTAQGMGYSGSPQGLLDPDTNMKYAVKYLRGAWLVSDGSEEKAVGWYARGYYYEAKRRGLLKETGLRA